MLNNLKMLSGPVVHLTTMMTRVPIRKMRCRWYLAAMREWRADSRGLDTERADLRASLVSRIDRSMTFTITREMERMERA